MRDRVSCPWFVGRGEELGVLAAALEDVTAGGSAAMLVGGDAGIGKSRLVGELIARAEVAGAEVLTGTCLDLTEGGAPYAPVREMLAGLSTRLDLAEHREILGTELWSDAAVRPAETLPSVLTTLCRLRPVVLVVEDLHWADHSTRDLITYLAAGPALPHLLVVVTYRRDDLQRGHPLWSTLAMLDRAQRVHHLRLVPFGAADLIEQLRGILGHQPDAELARIVIERSDGNPFLVEEVAAMASDGRLSPGMRELLLAHVDRLPERAQTVLRTAAVGGRRVEHTLLAAVSAMDELELSTDLRTAIGQHLIVAEDDHYRFRHALLHDAVLDDLLPGERRAIHAAYATTIEGDSALGGPEPAATLLHHWSSAGRTGPALAAAMDAARNAEATYALYETQRYLEWALAAWPTAVPQEIPADELPMTRDELLHWAADVASRAGDLVRAAEFIGEALDGVDPRAEPSRAGLLHERRGWCLLQTGHVDAALDEYRRAVELVPDRPPTAARARVLAASADASERADRIDTARSLALDAIAAAAAADSPADEGHARHTLGVCLAASGDRAAGLAELDHALAIAEQGGDVADAVGVHLHLWRELAQLGRGDEVADRARLGADHARGTGMHLMAGVLDGMAAGYLHQLGRWDEADKLIVETDPKSIEGLVHLIVGGLIDVDRGELDRAGDRLEIAHSLTTKLRDGRIDGLVSRGLAERAWWQGRIDDVQAIVAEGLACVGDADMVARLILIGLRGDGTGDSTSDIDTVTRGVDRLRTLERSAIARHLDASSELRAAAATGEAELARAEGRPDAAAWAEAARRWQVLGFPLLRVYCRWRQAEALLGRGGSRDVAAELLAAAWETAHDLGATLWCAAIEKSARRARFAVGAQTPSPSTSPTESNGTFGLTPREYDVLGLLCRGRTNRQIADTLFISEGTTRVHVSHIMTKLNASTRGEAADIAHRHGILRHAATPPGRKYAGDTTSR